MVMLEEMAVVEENRTWELVDPRAGCRPIGLKWVFKVKWIERRSGAEGAAQEPEAEAVEPPSPGTAEVPPNPGEAISASPASPVFPEQGTPTAAADLELASPRPPTRSSWMPTTTERSSDSGEWTTSSVMQRCRGWPRVSPIQSSCS